jgi:putative pyruvate formate lyase activating enzyme
MACHNLNLVTPTHVAPQVLAALDQAVEEGLNLPLVWNCGGYEPLSVLKVLDGVVDIYMPDVKTLDPEVADRLLRAPDYPQVVREALIEMHRQVGDLLIDEQGLAQRGLLVRHLVLPHGLADTPGVAKLVAQISTNTYFNLMDQYRPCHLAHRTEGIERPTSLDEFTRAREEVLAAGLTRLD